MWMNQNYTYFSVRSAKNRYFGVISLYAMKWKWLKITGLYREANMEAEIFIGGSLNPVMDDGFGRDDNDGDGGTYST